MNASFSCLHRPVRLLIFALLSWAISAAPALADVTISSPSNGERVSSPFHLVASAGTCSSQSVRTIGYSLDDSHDTTLIHTQSMDLQVAVPAGMHTVHVKAWAAGGSVCVAQVAVNVTNATGNVTSANAEDDSDDSVVPSNAKVVSGLQASEKWQGDHDNETSGASSGETRLVDSPSYNGPAREFVAHFRDGGGERFHLSFGGSRKAKNFFYDAWIYFTDSSKHISNLELDMYQTMSNGQTLIFGMQCDGYSNTWDYTENLGTPESPRGHWVHTRQACDVRKWSTNQWHHVQMSYSRHDDGTVTYKSVYLDGVRAPIHATVLSAHLLGWGSTLLTNFQLDGRGSSGSATVYLGALTVSRW